MTAQAHREHLERRKRLFGTPPARPQPVFREPVAPAPPPEPAQIDEPAQIKAIVVVLPTAVIRAIQYAVCAEFGVKLKDLIGPCRRKHLALARQVAMYLSKTLANRSYPEVGRRFGNRDHTTVLFAVRKMEALIPNDPELAARIEKIRVEIDSIRNQQAPA